MLSCPSFSIWGFFMFKKLIGALFVLSSFSSIYANNCPYFGTQTCQEVAIEALKVRLAHIQKGKLSLGEPNVFCAALDEADSETVLYSYNFQQIKGQKGLNFKAKVELTLRMDECVNPIVVILN